MFADRSLKPAGMWSMAMGSCHRCNELKIATCESNKTVTCLWMEFASFPSISLCSYNISPMVICFDTKSHYFPIIPNTFLGLFATMEYALKQMRPSICMCLLDIYSDFFGRGIDIQ